MGAKSLSIKRKAQILDELVGTLGEVFFSFGKVAYHLDSGNDGGFTQPLDCLNNNEVPVPIQILFDLMSEEEARDMMRIMFGKLICNRLNADATIIWR